MRAAPGEGGEASMSGAVRLERLGKVALVRLESPPANVLSLAVLGELAETFAGLAAKPPGAVVLAGTDRVFSAGADVRELGSPGGAASVTEAFGTALGALAGIERATIAAVSGAALGGGLELALACDLRLVGEGARLGQPEVLLGLIPGGGGTQRLARLLGVGRAKELILTGRQVGAEEAVRIGLAERSYPRQRLLDEALGLATSLAGGALAAQALAKRAIAGGLDLPLAEALSLERRLFVEAASTRDAGIGVASFLAHGPGRAEFVGE